MSSMEFKLNSFNTDETLLKSGLRCLSRYNGRPGLKARGFKVSVGRLRCSDPAYPRRDMLLSQQLSAGLKHILTQRGTKWS
eukprot:scaffold58917_cov23-Prasinocladus_malaysianus.AAC.1